MTTTEKRPHSASDDQWVYGTPNGIVVAGPNIPGDQDRRDTHTALVTGDQTSTISHTSSDARAGSAGGGPSSLADQGSTDTHTRCVGEGPNLRDDHRTADTQNGRVAGDSLSIATGHAAHDAHGDLAGSYGPYIPSDPPGSDVHGARVAGDPISTISQGDADTHTIRADGGPNPLVDHRVTDIHGGDVGEGVLLRNGHSDFDAHGVNAVAALTSPEPTNGAAAPTAGPSVRAPSSPTAATFPTSIAPAPSGTPDTYTDHVGCDNQTTSVGVGLSGGSGLRSPDTQSTGAATALTSPTAVVVATATEAAPSGTPSPPTATEESLPSATAPSGAQDSATDQPVDDIQDALVGGAPISGTIQISDVNQAVADCVAPTPPGPAVVTSAPSVCAPILADPLLELSAAVLDDLERVRIANENRLRQLTRDTDDKDGEERGFGLTLDNPDVLNLAALVRSMRCDATVVVALIGKSPKTQGCCLEHDAERELTRKLKKHPLGPWFAAQRGVGPKQAARLIAKVGDPFIKPDIYKKSEDGEVYLAEVSRPRLVSELWSYCGYGDSREQVRRKGHKANWSSPAKMRAFNIIDSCVKQVSKTCEVVKDDKGAYLHAAHAPGCTCSPYRLAYDRGRAKYKDSVHPWECDRCSPKGKPPAPAGSPRSPKHQHQAAVRLATKEFLRDLWREAQRLHGVPDGHPSGDAHTPPAVGAPSSSGDQPTCDTHGLCVTGGPIPLDGHGRIGTHVPSAVGAPSLVSGHSFDGTHRPVAAGEPA